MVTEGNLTTEQEQINTLLQAKMKAIYNRDKNAILSLYLEHIVSFDIMKPLQNNGTAAIAQRLDKWFAGYKSPINQEIANLEIAVGGEVAYSHCLTRTYGTAANDEDMDMWYRTTDTYRKVDGKWFITHEHNSEPIDMETGKALFDLKP